MVYITTYCSISIPKRPIVGEAAVSSNRQLSQNVIAPYGVKIETTHNHSYHHNNRQLSQKVIAPYGVKIETTHNHSYHHNNTQAIAL